MSYKHYICLLIKLNDKTRVTSANIRNTQLIPERLYVIQLLCYDRYEKRLKPSPWLSDIEGNTSLQFAITFSAMLNIISTHIL